MKIIELKSQNVKRLTAVEIKPDGSLVVIGGKNGNGKTSVLDSILFALGGGRAIQKDPVRHGADRAEVNLDLGDYTVRRVMRAEGGGTLTVKSKDGGKYGQGLLDGLVRQISLDPLKFTRLEAKKQVETLRDLVGLDFSKLDADRAAQYDARRDANREVKRLESVLSGLPHHEDAPSDEVSAAGLLREIEAAEAHNEQGERLLADASRASHALDAARQHEEELEAALKRARAEAAQAEAEFRLVTERAEAFEAKPTNKLRARLESAEATNHLVRENARRSEVEAELAAATEEAAKHDARIEELDAAKSVALASADMPIAGLSFGADGVTFNGVPFEQCSAAEQLRVSVAMALALQPDLKVLLIKDGSLLDEDSLRMVAEMAEAADAQVWIERVGDGDEGAIVIEDGHVREAAAVK